MVFTSEVKYKPDSGAEYSQRTKGAISVHPGPAALLCETPVLISFGIEQHSKLKMGLIQWLDFLTVKNQHMHFKWSHEINDLGLTYQAGNIKSLNIQSA